MASPKPYSISVRSIRDKMGTLQMPVATAADCEKLARLEGLSLENPSVINGILYYLGSLAVTIASDRNPRKARGTIHLAAISIFELPLSENHRALGGDWLQR